jgi:hypothetical protein
MVLNRFRWDIVEYSFMRVKAVCSQNESELAKSLSGKTLTSIYRSSDHPTLFFHFDDGSAYQVLVAGYDPIAHSPTSPISSSSSSQLHGGGGGFGPGTIQKKLELDPFLESVTQAGQTTLLELKITHSALIRLADKAFERRSSVSHVSTQSPVPPSPAESNRLARTFTSSSATSSEDNDRTDRMEVDQLTEEPEAETETETEMEKTLPPLPPLTPTYSEQRWNQHHMSLALKFEGVDGWHCISASMQSRPSPSSMSSSTCSTPTLTKPKWTFPTAAANNASSTMSSPTFLSPPPDTHGEVFRSYEDVYVNRVQTNHAGGGGGGGPRPQSPVKIQKKMGHARQTSEWSEWSFSSGGSL